MRPQTNYAKSGDVNIAYQVVGTGPIDLVWVPGWISHLDAFWQIPRYASFLERLASFSRLILFDKRGTGLSDPVPVEQLATLEQRMGDLRAVLDAVGSSRAALFGASEGGSMCTLFAATYPDRTTALALYGAYANFSGTLRPPGATERRELNSCSGAWRSHGVTWEACSSIGRLALRTMRRRRKPGISRSGCRPVRAPLLRTLG